ncbi:MAG: hypothetical protein ACD_60C00126G0015 [uncultured bacterium]|nr:MAG: hypothetical protein ACD_60C00126G0015 [uncultured bacterium]
MKKILRTCLIISVFLVSSIVLAGNRPGAFSVRLADGYYFFADKRDLKNTTVPTIEVGYDFNQRFAMKGGVGILNTHSTNTNTSNNVHGMVYTIDGIYRFNHDERLEPYFLAGIGVIGLKPNGANPVNQANVNAGLGTQLFVTNSLAFDIEAKDLYTMSGGKNDVMLTVGINFLIGG